jgi:hypothetical protein
MRAKAALTSGSHVTVVSRMSSALASNGTLKGSSRPTLRLMSDSTSSSERDSANVAVDEVAPLANEPSSRRNAGVSVETLDESLTCEMAKRGRDELTAVLKSS